MNQGQAIYHMENTRFLIYDGDRDGIPYAHVEDDETGFVSESEPAETFLKHGYWDPVV